MSRGIVITVTKYFWKWAILILIQPSFTLFSLFLSPQVGVSATPMSAWPSWPELAPTS